MLVYPPEVRGDRESRARAKAEQVPPETLVVVAERVPPESDYD
jgi:hypothetical protein